MSDKVICLTWKFLQENIQTWQKETFPLANHQNQIKKLEEEILEFKEANKLQDMDACQKEWSDIIIVCFLLDVLGSPIGPFMIDIMIETGRNLPKSIEEQTMKDVWDKFCYNRDEREFVWNEELGVYKGHAKKKTVS